MAKDVAALYVTRMEDSRKFQARVLLVAEDLNLALLDIDETSPDHADFWSGAYAEMEPLEIATEEPPQGSELRYFSYPSGSEGVALALIRV